MPGTTCTRRSDGTSVSVSASGLLQRFDQEEDFGSHPVAQISGVGEGAVTAAGDNRLEGADEGEEPRGVGVGERSVKVTSPGQYGASE